MKIYGWTRPGRNAVAHYRIHEPLRGMKLLGHDVSTGHRLSAYELDGTDVVVTSVHAQEEASLGWQTIARMPGKPLLVYDIDDDVWNFDDTLRQAEYWGDVDNLRRVQADIMVSDVVTTPSPVLAGYLSELNPNVVVLPNTVPEYLTGMLVRAPSDFTVGYQGGDTHLHDVEMIVGELFSLLTRFTSARLHVWGPPSYEGPYADRVTVTPWQDSIRSYYASLRMSVGLAPLTNTAFNHAKSGVKALEYAALGFPVVASNLPTYEDWVVHGVTGFLADGPDDFYDALAWLATNPMMRRTMGDAARSWAVERTTERCAHRWVEAYSGRIVTVP